MDEVGLVELVELVELLEEVESDPSVVVDEESETVVVEVVCAVSVVVWLELVVG